MLDLGSRLAASMSLSPSLRQLFFNVLQTALDMEWKLNTSKYTSATVLVQSPSNLEAMHVIFQGLMHIHDEEGLVL